MAEAVQGKMCDPCCSSPFPVQFQSLGQAPSQRLTRQRHCWHVPPQAQPPAPQCEPGAPSRALPAQRGAASPCLTSGQTALRDRPPATHMRLVLTHAEQVQPSCPAQRHTHAHRHHGWQANQALQLQARAAAQRCKNLPAFGTIPCAHCIAIGRRQAASDWFGMWHGMRAWHVC